MNHLRCCYSSRPRYHYLQDVTVETCSHALRFDRAWQCYPVFEAGCHLLLEGGIAKPIVAITRLVLLAGHGERLVVDVDLDVFPVSTGYLQSHQETVTFVFDVEVACISLPATRPSGAEMRIASRVMLKTVAAECIAHQLIHLLAHALDLPVGILVIWIIVEPMLEAGSKERVIEW